MSTVETQVLRTGKTFEELCEASGVDSLPEGDFAAPRDVVEALRETERLVDALGLLAHALPSRQAVWWAWSCIRDSVESEAAPEIAASIEATGRWIKEPTDGNRRTAYEAAQAADMTTAVGCVGAAVFFCGGSLGPADQDAVPPEEYMAAKAIVGALLLAASTEPEEMFSRMDQFMDRGLEVAERVGLWQPPEG